MSDNDMFTDTNTQPNMQETPASSGTDLFADKLNEIKNESGEPKYKDVPTALAALQESQRFIETLKQEKAAEAAKAAEARLELEKLGTIDDFVKRFDQPAKTDDNPVTPESPKGLSEEKVAELLQKQLQQRDEQSQQAKNLADVQSKLSQAHGDKAAEFIKQKAAELNTSVDALKELAKTNPSLALAALGGKGAVSTASSQSSINSTLEISTDNPRPTWEKGATRGGLTDKELAERFRQSKTYTNKRIGLE